MKARLINFFQMTGRRDSKYIAPAARGYCEGCCAFVGPGLTLELEKCLHNARIEA